MTTATKTAKDTKPATVAAPKDAAPAVKGADAPKFRAPKERETAQSLGMMLGYGNATKAEVEAWLKANNINRSRAEEIVAFLPPALTTQVTLPDAAVGGGGKAPPKAGEKRSYKAQQLDDGYVFLRLPVDQLGIIKGGMIDVLFGTDKIEVTKGK